MHSIEQLGENSSDAHPNEKHVNWRGQKGRDKGRNIEVKIRNTWQKIRSPRLDKCGEKLK